VSKPPKIRGNIDDWLLSHSRAKHECGISQSATLAARRFDELATEYLILWSPGAGYDIFECQLQLIKERVLDEVASIWKISDATQRWYETVCAPSVRAAVSGKLEEFKGKARDSELVFLVRTKIDELSQPLDRAGLTEANLQDLPESVAAVEGGPPEGERGCPSSEGSTCTVQASTVAENVALPVQDQEKATSPTHSPTRFGQNIDRLRKECGWSFDQLADEMGCEKKLILGHVNKGRGAHPKTKKTYAQAFTRALERTVTVQELES